MRKDLQKACLTASLTKGFSHFRVYHKIMKDVSN